MADLHNPLFEDEKEFLEHQKLEYERALLGDVEEIKAKTQEVGKYVAIGAGILGGAWLLSKALGGRKSPKKLKGPHQDEYNRHLKPSAPRPRRVPTSTTADTAVTDDLGFGSGHHQPAKIRTQPTPASKRADIAPDVYHTDADPFQPVNTSVRYPITAYQAATPPPHQQEASSIFASAIKSFLQSDTGKVLVAQASAVLMAYVAKKAGEYLPMLKNPDLAASGSVHAEPETKDIDFTYHHDDADAPHQPV
ncbi:hypothetical protein ACFPAF_17615 [Hymenobacter endophyticus]|uniref:Uncharacterized protein n=1 Tax=Hymenobacter endophyticus TaxID=3076335 RepID=A0ABU3TLH2_9BACT|nr:hypothetical protein [Hymenobacter endophyticus]MDU0372226.1 hypothetical protein [Hymenobacter endophyticus]